MMFCGRASASGTGSSSGITEWCVIRARSDENSLVKPCVSVAERLDNRRLMCPIVSRRAKLNYLNLVAARRLQDQIVRHFRGGRRHAQRQCKAAGLGAALAHQERTRRLSGQYLQRDFARQTGLEPGCALQFLMLERIEARRRRCEDFRTGVGCWVLKKSQIVSEFCPASTHAEHRHATIDGVTCFHAFTQARTRTHTHTLMMET